MSVNNYSSADHQAQLNAAQNLPANSLQPSASAESMPSIDDIDSLFDCAIAQSASNAKETAILQGAVEEGNLAAQLHEREVISETAGKQSEEMHVTNEAVQQSVSTEALLEAMNLANAHENIFLLHEHPDGTVGLKTLQSMSSVEANQMQTGHNAVFRHGNQLAVMPQFAEAHGYTTGQVINYKDQNGAIQQLQVVVLSTHQSKLLMNLIDSFIDQIQSTEEKNDKESDDNLKHAAKPHQKEPHTVTHLRPHKRDEKEKAIVQESTASTPLEIAHQEKKIIEKTVENTRENIKDALRVSKLKDQKLAKIDLMDLNAGHAFYAKSKGHISPLRGSSPAA